MPTERSRRLGIRRQEISAAVAAWEDLNLKTSVLNPNCATTRICRKRSGPPVCSHFWTSQDELLPSKHTASCCENRSEARQKTKVMCQWIRYPARLAARARSSPWIQSRTIPANHLIKVIYFHFARALCSTLAGNYNRHIRGHLFLIWWRSTQHVRSYRAPFRQLSNALDLSTAPSL